MSAWVCVFQLLLLFNNQIHTMQANEMSTSTYRNNNIKKWGKTIYILYICIYGLVKHIVSFVVSFIYVFFFIVPFQSLQVWIGRKKKVANYDESTSLLHTFDANSAVGSVILVYSSVTKYCVWTTFYKHTHQNKQSQRKNAYNIII